MSYETAAAQFIHLQPPIITKEVKIMGYTAKQLVAIAEAEIGYHEKATNSNLDSKTANSGKGNYTKYSRDLHKAGYYNGNKQGFDWCDQFVDWCFFKLCGSKDKAEYLECQTGNYGAGCGFSLKYYKAAGRFDDNPKVGDQIFFKYSNDDSTADHTGIVVRVTDKLIETIEGNSGNEVRRKAYQRTDKTIIGYGHPRYDAEPKKTVIKEVKTVKIEMPVLRRGSSGTAVKTLQRLLRQLQYVNLDGKTLLIVDGSFGSNTEAAVKRYQKNRGAKNPDGIVGEWTWNKLLNGR